MTFKGQAADDINNVFFNTDEFAEYAEVDGKTVPIIIDNDALNGKTELYAFGLSAGEQLIFLKEADLGRLPQIGEQITINGKQWYIKHSLANAGVFEIRIGRERVYE